MHRLANFFRDRGLAWSSWNKQLTETACGRYRPDFVFEAPTHAVMVEVDEHQHARLGYACDAVRMLDIYNSFGGLPIVFVRFNPDEFTVDGERGRVPWSQRLAALDSAVRGQLSAPPARPLVITRLFYDSVEELTQTTWADPCDPTFTERPLGGPMTDENAFPNTTRV